MHKKSAHLKKLYLIGLLVAVMITIFSFAWRFYIQDAESRGIDLNRKAWEASYIERGLSIPASGPREGFWGARLGKKIRDSRLGWHEPEVHVPGLLEIDNNGHQKYESMGKKKYNILMVGGSVAFGAYASEIPKTYFNIVGRSLDNQRAFSDITIIAAGAWKSIQELRAVEEYHQHQPFDLIVFLNGLNDLTNGATAKTLYGEKIRPTDGSSWTLLYHAHDYRQRVSNYLNNMDVAWNLCQNAGGDMLVVLQPSLVERSNRTKIEEALIKGSLKPHASAQSFTESYASIRAGLINRSRKEGFHYLDCSRSFNGEPETTFADIWHFSDFGHKILAEAMAEKISTILKQRKN
ncbi:MAG: SGNH/GDSL hydrolase family protein [Desulfobacterales bacterium]